MGRSRKARTGRKKARTGYLGRTRKKARTVRKARAAYSSSSESSGESSGSCRVTVTVKLTEVKPTFCRGHLTAIGKGTAGFKLADWNSVIKRGQSIYIPRKSNKRGNQSLKVGGETKVSLKCSLGDVIVPSI